MNSSFYNGVSGMKTHQFGIDVWSANITGVNTAGFKATTPEFSSIYASTAANNYSDPSSNDIGYGAMGQATTTNFAHGSVVDTDGEYDMAINGDGWFGVVDKNGDKFYTRAGAFKRDRDGFLVDDGGNYVTGTSANNVQNNSIINDPKNTIALDDVNAQSRIQIPDDLVIPPEATTEVNFSGSLDAQIKTEFSAVTEKEEEVPNVEIYRTDIFDENGEKNFLEITFTKVVPQATEGISWNATAVLTDKDKNPISTKDGKIDFNERGAIVSNTLTSIDNNGTEVALNFGTLYDPNMANSGFDGLVSLSGFESERVTTKDGHKAGHLQDYGIASDGTVMASFDNGQNVPISKIAIYNFTNDEGLEQSNPIYFKESSNSGKALFLKDKAGNNVQTASISTHKLEMSNVDLSTALTELLVMQKAYDASSKSITTSDEMIQNAINMKR